MSASASAAALRPVDLRCKNRADPICIDVAMPRLSWDLESPDPEARQVAYRLLVATRPGLLTPGEADPWDSGKIDSPDSVGVSYAGAPLSAGMRIFWRVRVWDATGGARLSDVAGFEVGPLSADDWQAEWINADQPEPSTTEAWYEERPGLLMEGNAGLVRHSRRGSIELKWSVNA